MDSLDRMHPIHPDRSDTCHTVQLHHHAPLLKVALVGPAPCSSTSNPRMRSEGFPFIVGGVGVGPVFAWLASSRRLSSFVVACRRRRVSNLLPLGEAFASDFAWTCHVSVCAAIPL